MGKRDEEDGDDDDEGMPKDRRGHYDDRHPTVRPKLHEKRRQSFPRRGKVYNVKSSLGECSRKVQKVQRTLRNEHLSTRAATIQRHTQLRRPRTEPVENAEEDPANKDRKRVLTRQTRENVYSLKMKMDSIERDVKVMRSDKRN